MRAFVFTILIGASMAAPQRALADWFVLASGGRLEGELLNPKRQPIDDYAIGLRSGVKVTLARDQVTRVIPATSAEADYERYLAKMEDTVDHHWKLAEWCAKYNLAAQREFHLATVVEREPEHEKARQALGYVKINGRWVQPDEHHRRLGYVKYEGAWRTPQEIALLTARDNAKAMEKKWNSDVRMWRSWLNRPSKAAEGAAALAAINNPWAVPAIVDLANDAKEPTAHKQIYIDVLGRLAPTTAMARGALVNHAIYNDDPALRDKCLDYLEKCDRRAVGRMFTVALGDKSNKAINRAAVGIARMNDDSAVPALIEALTTKHKFIVRTGTGSGAGIGASFGGPGGGGLTAGGSTKMVEQDVQNESVLHALVALTDGKHLGYNKEAWKQWYAQSQAPQEVDLRRRK